MYLFADTETGGTDPSQHSLLSVGLIAGDESGIKAQIEILIKDDPYRVQARAMEINRINLIEHDAKALDKKDAAMLIREFIWKNFPKDDKPTIVGHNIDFDTNFMSVLFKGQWLDIPWSYRKIDTASIGKALLDSGKITGSSNASSSALFKIFEVFIPDHLRHTALGDCHATYSLYYKMIKLIRGQ